jgi:glyoxylate reductase
MPIIFVASNELFDTALAMLREVGEVRIHDGRGPVPRAEMEAGVADADALVAVLHDRVDGPLLDLAPRLKIVANVAVGYDNIDVPAASSRGVMVTNTPGVLTEATADLTWTLILGVARRVGEAERFLREGTWRDWSFRRLLGIDLHGKRLAVLGYGRIGKAVARRAEAFGMTVEGATSSDPPARVDEMIAAADVVTIHVPLAPATRHFLDARRIALMKPDAILINTSRGPVVDEAALAEALISGRLRGAGLDVFEREPVVHPLLLEAPNAMLLPHVGSATEETRRRMAETAARNVVEALAGRTPPNLVAPDGR